MAYSKAIAICGAIVVASAAIATTPLAAAPNRPIVVTGPRNEETITRYVSYRDLNLASQAGEKALKLRVRKTVHDVCDELNPDYSAHDRWPCQLEAWHGARPQISQAVMRARQLASTGQSLVAATAITLSFPK
jgi:UrcA family protein